MEERGGTATPNSDYTGSLAQYGSVVSVTATFGQCAAGWLMDRVASAKAGIATPI